MYNNRWGNTTVIELDTWGNQRISQKVNLTQGLYEIKVQYAARAKYVNSSAMSIYWNQQQVAYIESKD